MTTTAAYPDAPTLVGTDLGWTDWVEVTQDRVDLFADATDDHQWIHVDPERAKDGPFGAPIAHGFLSLSLTVKFWSELFDLDGVTTKVNYGLDKVRFVSPVKVGSRVRGGAVIAEVTEVAGGYQFAVDQTIEIEGGTKPAVVARGLYRFYA
ncbi:MaoC family dehydratase [Microbacterium sp. cx-55]|uniref:MaoC family dehydratase n=1 Tax=unclassified Microbacterium TaxID=2609290 RepID=UPI001CBA9AE2|nr:MULTISPECIES: MaoC family dehydratase [unclassified Microbacterium]MBZ4488356.1 MaoC family dehydratase [Microbacterium sp. cx-55]MCC4909415.1 MaoC family dehydratase [Microbacterium sp. cx-59]UGB35010.1 MaoC family dehydratase [Microbacterium sp. cx-55]